MSPDVSVLLPVFNAERYVAAAVRSVLAQTFGDFELIAVNDGSTDRSGEILAGLAATDPRVRIISRPNAGLVASLNEALALARGAVIARMDADDIALPERFERQVAYLKDHPDCVLLGTNVATIDRDGDLIGRMRDLAFGHDEIDNALLRRGWPVVHPTVMMRADALRSVGGYQPGTCPYEDHDLFLRLIEVGRVENLPEVLLHYRKHAASISAHPESRDHIVVKVIIDACRRRGLPVHPDVTRVHTGPSPQADIERSWGWEAVKARNIGTARKYALRTVRRRPLSVESWRLTYCAVRGR